MLKPFANLQFSASVLLSIVLVVAMTALGGAARAEGRCPRGQYEVGGQGMLGCAPISAGNADAQQVGLRPTGKWEARWGAIAEDFSANERGVAGATGVSTSQKSKRAANSMAVDECTKLGGQKCRVVISYYNQCVAIADPKPVSQGGIGGKSAIYRAETQVLAESEAMKRCSADGKGECSVIYSGCSMSEFKSF